MRSQNVMAGHATVIGIKSGFVIMPPVSHIKIATEVDASVYNTLKLWQLCGNGTCQGAMRNLR